MKLGGSKKLDLTYFDERRMWKKKYRGKVYYCKIKNGGRTDGEGYAAALRWWEDLKASLDKETQAATLAAGGGHGVFGDLTKEDFKDSLREEAERDAWLAAVGKDDAGNPVGTYSDWKAEREALAFAASVRRREAEVIDPASTVDSFVTRFLNFKKQQSKSNQRSNGRFVNLRTNVKQFGDFVGTAKAAKDVQWGMVLQDYYVKLLGRITEGELSEYAGRDKLQVARQFIRRLWELGVIDLPRNLDSKELTIEAAAGAIELSPFAVFKALIAKSPEVWNGYYPLKLYLLLKANCGMTQKDIADLKQSEVDWTEGTITRKRSKKQRKTAKSIPTVKYKLWPITFRLLKKYRSKDTDLVLVNRTGGKLRATTLSNKSETSDKASNTDLIATAYNEWLAQQDDEQAPSLKYFRKASSTRFGKHKEFKGYSEYFLGQSPKSTADKHYVVPDQEQFDEAVEWLGKEYSVDRMELP
jgi:integrase